MQRIVFHIDMDAFFSSIEQLSNPHLKGRPVIVCGDPYRRSVVSTSSYEARKYGLKSGMPVCVARRLCPDGVYITGNPQKYVYTSVRILGIFREFTSLVEPFSVDEAFLEFNDISFDDSVRIAKRIKESIRKSLNLTCSIGISTNKFVSKMASSLDKPDGLTVVKKDEFLEKFGGMNVNQLWGVGDKTASKLKKLGILKISDLAEYSEKTLKKIFGVYGSYLKIIANGIDDSPLIPYYQGIQPKSIGHERTLPFDTSDEEYILSCLLQLTEQVGRRMRKEGYLCNTVTIKIRYKEFKTITRQRKLEEYIERDDLLFETARNLFQVNYNGEQIRLLGVSASGLIKKFETDMDPIFSNDKRHDFFTKVIDSIRDRFGEDSVKKGGIIRLQFPAS